MNCNHTVILLNGDLTCIKYFNAFTRNQGHTGVNKLGIMYLNVILTTKPFYDSIIESNSDSVVISVK